MKAEVGSLLFIKDKNDETKRRPYMCVYVFTNNAGVPYDWLIIPITSTNKVGMDNLVEVSHRKLCCKSYAKINNIESISWNEEIEVSKQKFGKKHVKDVIQKLSNLFQI